MSLGLPREDLVTLGLEQDLHREDLHGIEAQHCAGHDDYKLDSGAQDHLEVFDVRDHLGILKQPEGVAGCVHKEREEEGPIYLL